MYLVVAEITARPERRDDLVALLTQFGQASRQEPGNLSYRFTTDIEDELSFWSIETWEDEQALATHLGSPELAAGLAALESMVAAAPVITGYEVAGDPKRWA